MIERGECSTSTTSVVIASFLWFVDFRYLARELFGERANFLSLSNLTVFQEFGKAFSGDTTL